MIKGIRKSKYSFSKKKKKENSFMGKQLKVETVTGKKKTSEAIFPLVLENLQKVFVFLIESCLRLWNTTMKGSGLIQGNYKVAPSQSAEKNRINNKFS